MTPQAALGDLLDRLAAQQSAAVHVGNDELRGWPTKALAAMKAARILVKARHASSIVCPGCERECAKPVDVFPAEDGRPARAFIVCNEPEDLGRIPLEMRALERWQITGEILAGALNRLLGFAKSPQQDRTGKSWTLGLLKGKEHKGEVKLAVDDDVMLLIAGHSVLVADIITFDGDNLTADREELLKLVDKPVNALSYEASTTRREARMLNTKAMHESWQKEYRSQKRKRQNMSDVWYSKQIAKMDIACGRSADTIRKHMKL